MLPCGSDFLQFNQTSSSTENVLHFVQGLQLSHRLCKDAAGIWLHHATSLPGADVAGL